MVVVARGSLETKGPKQNRSVSENQDESAFGILWTSSFVYDVDITRDKRTQTKQIGLRKSRPVGIWYSLDLVFRI